MNITISTDIFATVSLFRGIDDIRHYLNGAYLETGTHGARLIATDGHQLAVARIEGEYPESSVILPSSLVAAVKLKVKAPQFVMLAFSEGNQQFNAKGVFIPRDITLTFGEITTTAKELDGKFPDYRRVVPGEVDGTPAQFDPRFINRLDKACCTLGYQSFSGIAYNGNSSALSIIDENFVVVTMPFKVDPLNYSPAWVQESLSQPAPVILAV